MRIMDGNEAAAYIAYAFTEVAGIYPITPSSPMAELTDVWAANGKKNIFGQKVRLVEMQSEAGAIGAVHGALEAGALATSYTSSQGLMLMIPTMYRISGQRHPGVLHVSSRTVGTHAFSIFGDHSDVMGCRQTGFAMLSTGSVQEIMDLAGIAHLSAIKSRVPFMHFFDGFRTSHEIQKVECLEYDDLEKLVDFKALDAFRKNSLNPERPVLRSTVQNPDIYFQVREANNRFYEAVPGIVENYMKEINKLTGRDYKLFNYYGAQDAESIIIAMGSVSGAIKETVDYLCAKGEKVGYVQVHLYRPFSVKHLLEVIPGTVNRIAVLDRTKELGAIGEPLYEDICTAYANAKERPDIYAGRYGLSSKDTTPAQIKAVYDNLKVENPKNHFTVGIVDDVTNLSLEVGSELELGQKDMLSCKFWGLGSDGTVGANKNSIKIIGDNTDFYTQAYFEYDTKKSYGITKSHLRFGKSPIRSSYLIKKADFVACHNQSYIYKYDMVTEIKKGGTFLLNCSWSESELDEKLPAKVKQYIANNDIKLYIIDAIKVSRELGLGNRANAVLQSAFFQLAKIIPVEDAVEYMKQAIKKTYAKKGEKIVKMNCDAVDKGIQEAKEVKVPEYWANACDTTPVSSKDVPDIIKNILIPINALEGDELPVSAFKGMEDGTMPLGTSAYEKRGIATDIPEWKPEDCIQCNLCAYVCPHASIRPFLLHDEEVKNAPEGLKNCQAKGKGVDAYQYTMQISTLDCTGCGNCVDVCPSKGKALFMKPLEEEEKNQILWDYTLSLKDKEGMFEPTTVKGSQFKQPLLEFSGACAGCGETPYVKLLTQLYGDRIYIANGTGCSQAWGAAMPCIPYTTNKEGKGPAWSNSLFENNAEFSLGMCLAVTQQRERLKMLASELKSISEDHSLIEALNTWMEYYDDGEKSIFASKALVKTLTSSILTGKAKEIGNIILNNRENLSKKSMWMVGGDGWAYDIGFSGLDHVIASGEDVNILIVDTEVYSNTGGQSSKATPLAAVAQFAASGKKNKKKDLGLMLMSYGHVYVAQVAMGANPNQLIKAMVEAEKFPGPSIVIAYAPCVAHGLKNGMSSTQSESKKAVEAGYWHLYRYNPLLKENAFALDSKEPTASFKEFLRGEVRYSSLERTFPEIAEVLFDQAEQAAKEKYESYKQLANRN